MGRWETTGHGRPFLSFKRTRRVAVAPESPGQGPRATAGVDAPAWTAPLKSPLSTVPDGVCGCRAGWGHLAISLVFVSFSFRGDTVGNSFPEADFRLLSLCLPAHPFPFALTTYLIIHSLIINQSFYYTFCLPSHLLTKCLSVCFLSTCPRVHS